MKRLTDTSGRERAADKRETIRLRRERSGDCYLSLKSAEQLMIAPIGLLIVQEEA
jgi:hypothetical protein